MLNMLWKEYLAYRQSETSFTKTMQRALLSNARPIEIFRPDCLPSEETSSVSLNCLYSIRHFGVEMRRLVRWSRFPWARCT